VKIENGKIIEVTRTEIYNFWLAGEWEEIITFLDFLRAIEQAGVKIVEDRANEDK
jgi:hypothetical protein